MTWISTWPIKQILSMPVGPGEITWFRLREIIFKPKILRIIFNENLNMKKILRIEVVAPISWFQTKTLHKKRFKSKSEGFTSNWLLNDLSKIEMLLNSYTCRHLDCEADATSHWKWIYLNLFVSCRASMLSSIKRYMQIAKSRLLCVFKNHPVKTRAKPKCAWNLLKFIWNARTRLFFRVSAIP